MLGFVELESQVVESHLMGAGTKLLSLTIESSLRPLLFPLLRVYVCSLFSSYSILTVVSCAGSTGEVVKTTVDFVTQLRSYGR